MAADTPSVVCLRFRDGVEHRIEARDGESVLAAALRAGVPLVHQCESGSCGTCVAQLVDGETQTLPGRALSLLVGEIRDGWRLTCSVTPLRESVFDIDYASTVLEGPRPRIVPTSVTGLDRVAKTVVQLELELDRTADFSFECGQYVRIRVPGSDVWRSYSMATTPKELPRMRFLVRLIEGGAMSSWLEVGCAVGARAEVEGPLGAFGLAPTKGPRLMVAGGTGLAPIMAMLDGLRARPGPKSSLVLCFGCTTEDDLFYLDEIELRRFWMPNLDVRVALMEPPGTPFDARIGTAVSLIDDSDLEDPSLSAYLCGPPAMIEAARARLIGAGVPLANIHAEHFRPT